MYIYSKQNLRDNFISKLSKQRFDFFKISFYSGESQKDYIEVTYDSNSSKGRVWYFISWYGIKSCWYSSRQDVLDYICEYLDSNKTKILSKSQIIREAKGLNKDQENPLDKDFEDLFEERCDFCNELEEDCDCFCSTCNKKTKKEIYNKEDGEGNIYKVEGCSKCWSSERC